MTSTLSDGQLEQTLRAGHFAVTAEITPRLSADPASMLERAAPLKGLVNAVNVTEGAGARAHLSSLAAAAQLVGALVGLVCDAYPFQLSQCHLNVRL